MPFKEIARHSNESEHKAKNLLTISILNFSEELEGRGWIEKIQPTKVQHQGAGWTARAGVVYHYKK